MVRRGRYESGAWAKVHWSQWKFPLKSIDWQSESSAHLGKDHFNAQKEMLRFSSMLESPAETIQCINKELTIKTLTQSSCPNLWNSLAGISGFVSLKHLDSPSKDPAMSHPSWVPMVSDRCITHLFPASQCEKEQEKKKSCFTSPSKWALHNMDMEHWGAYRDMRGAAWEPLSNQGLPSSHLHAVCITRTPFHA